MLEILLKNEVLAWVILTLNTLDSNEDFNAFIANYSTAFLLNSLVFLHNNSKNLKDFIPGGSEFVIFHIFIEIFHIF
jgi:hypothetical protein